MRSDTKWRDLLAIIRAGMMAIVMMSIIVVINGAASSIVYEQLPGHYGGYLSGGYSKETGTLIFTVADDFNLSQSANIVGIKWWGSKLLRDSFTIMIFDDNAGQPGNLLYSFNRAPVKSNKTDDWVNPPDPNFGFPGIPEYEFTFNARTPIIVNADTRYWLSIVNVVPDQWLWEASSPGDLGVVQRSFNSPVNGPWSWEPYYDNMSFQLSTTPFRKP